MSIIEGLYTPWPTGEDPDEVIYIGQEDYPEHEPKDLDSELLALVYGGIITEEEAWRLSDSSQDPLFS